MTKYKVHPKFKNFAEDIQSCISNFEASGEDFGNQDRNSLKLFQLDGQTINIKSFRVPNVINRIAYNFFRKSKAQRSYEYAVRLQELQIGTPQPIAYFETKGALFFGKSFYVSEQLNCNYTYRELTFDFTIKNWEDILRAFTRFTYQLHQKSINFLDHSPGNTLIKIHNGNYEFFLVDLNRMEFGSMDFSTRIKNFARLTIHENMVRIMSNEYANVSGEDEQLIFETMWYETQKFQERFHRKRRLKRKLKFWKTYED